MAQGTIIILDMGRNVSSEKKKDQSFFDNAKACTARIILRKILSQGKNLVSIILLGSKKTNNDMAKENDGAFKHIEVLSKLRPPTWKIIRELPKEPSKHRGDWFEALLVADNYYKNGTSGIKFASKKIILITNFKKCPSFEPNRLDEVVNRFNEKGYEVDMIGIDIYSKENDNESIKVARQFVEATNGSTSILDNILKYDLHFHRECIAKPSPWNVDLSIGQNIKIPVSTYIKIKDEPIVKISSKDYKHTTISTTKKRTPKNKIREFLKPVMLFTVEDFRRSTLASTMFLLSERSDGYLYGKAIIPYSDCDEPQYQPEQKCLSVYGFTHADNIKWQNLNGDGLSYVFGRKGNIKAQETVRCLVECLHKLNLVGIVKKVHNNNSDPKMLALMPVIDKNNVMCLSMTALCYKEDIKQMLFPATNLKKYTCSTEQVNAFKDLINAMDLTQAFDGKEAIPIDECVSPADQYVLDCIAFRAMYPNKPLPKPSQEIMSLVKAPPLLAENASEPLERLKSLFTLTKGVRKIKNYSPSDIDQCQTPHTSSG